MEFKEFNKAINRLFRLEIGKSNSHYQYYKSDDIELRLKKKLFRDTVENLTRTESFQGFELYNGNFYEVSLSQNSRNFYMGPSGRDDIEKKDLVNEIDYFLGSPSNEYLLFFINNLYDLSQKIRLTRPMMIRRFRNRRMHEESNGTLELFDVIKEVIPRFKTLQIRSKEEKALKDFEVNSSSFLFTLGYNSNMSFYPTNITEDFTRTVRISRIRRSSIEDIEPPKRKYNQDLILYYQKGISAESEDLQFLSFYHIFEHFFERIYNEDLLSAIQDKITSPAFSYKRTKDLNTLVKVIQNKLQYKNEEFKINEPEALRLVLDKFITDFEEVKKELNVYDDSLIDYYKTNEVSFSKGNRVNFDNERSSILKNLRERIYKTRNAIVHSKDTDKTKYLPFKHDKELSREIILMRIIAERVVIGSSTEL